jgi:hypothetical protein
MEVLKDFPTLRLNNSNFFEDDLKSEEFENEIKTEEDLSFYGENQDSKNKVKKQAIVSHNLQPSKVNLKKQEDISEIEYMKNTIK